jgi:hypothetical protein
VARTKTVTTRGNLERSTKWCGLNGGDAVIVDVVKERKNSYVFVAHVRNVLTGDEWVEVRGGRSGDSKDRSFRPELIYPASARKGSRLTGRPIQDVPQLPF